MRAGESPAITRRIRALEQVTGKPVILRGVTPSDRGFRGRVSEREEGFVVEYRDAPAGYFWHYEIIEELLALMERGQRSVVCREAESDENHDALQLTTTEQIRAN